MTKLYFAASESHWSSFEEYPQARLLSYYPVIIKRPPTLRNPLFCDSGAFKVMSGKLKITLEEYAAFLKKHKDEFEVYATLDVIGNHKATAINQAYLEEQGLNPMLWL